MMEKDIILNSALAIISLLFVATLVSFILKKSRVPYTVVLVLVGTATGLLAQRFEALAFLADLKLSPELVFYVFLPTLIFESAFHTHFKVFRRSFRMIFSLATVGMLFSALLIGVAMHYVLGFPWLIAFLFATLISATDPISVLALFKRIGAPKRLATIVEGESLFNDGTALVLFGILLELVARDQARFSGGDLLHSVGNFATIVSGGVLVGLVFGFLFSKALDYVKNSKEIEISLTLILAHFTFIVAEYFLGVSGILATVAAGIVVGNYGYYKISQEVRDIMGHFWDYSAFLANSVLFLMVGIIISSLGAKVSSLILPMLAVIAFVLLSRALMVYILLPLINLLVPKEKIPLKWMHVVNWSGLRGALAIALVLTLPEGFPYYNEMLIFTVGVIFFTIIFYGFTIYPLMGFLGFHSLSALESFEYDENQLLIDKKVREKLNEMKKNQFISAQVYKNLNDHYKAHASSCSEHINDLLTNNFCGLTHEQLLQVLKRHLLGIEKHVFTKLYYYGEITQELLNILLSVLEKQSEEDFLESKVALGKLTHFQHDGWLANILSKFGFHSFKKRIQEKEVAFRYEMFRARLIAIAEVIETIKEIKKVNVLLDKRVISDFEKQYKHWHANAKKKLSGLEKKHPDICHKTQFFLAQQAAFHAEEKALKDIRKTGMTSDKVYARLENNLVRRRDSLKI